MFLKYFTRPATDIYSRSIGGSVHFKFSFDGINYSPLNQNYGMLFAKSYIASDNTIIPCCIDNIKGYVLGEKYGIAADYIEIDGTMPKEGMVYFWTTTDFVEFDECGLVPIAELNGWNGIENDTFVINDTLGKNVIDRWCPLRAKNIFVPEKVNLHTMKDLEDVRAIVEYTDSSTDAKRVDWIIEDKDIDGEGNFLPGIHEIFGKIHKVSFPFPLTKGYADPVLFKWENYWYFLSTNDNLDDIGMFVRRAENEEDLFTDKAVERCILSYNLEKGYVQTFWAPEFHVIGGELYILFAVGGKQWAPQCHMMKLKKGGDILKPTSWEEPVRVVREDGSFLAEDGISLDMTHFEDGGKHYLVWSYRYGIATPLDTGSMLYIATTSEEKPWQLTSSPVLLSRPLYGWENTQGTINNEGPYALIHDEKIYLSFSGGSANGYSYAVGYLIADSGKDLLDVNSWKKTPCPMLSSYSVGIDGPGHNSFYVSDDGKTMVAYHGQLGPRCSAIHRVHFNKNGFPMLNMSLERDIPEEMREVSIRFNV